MSEYAAPFQDEPIAEDATPTEASVYELSRTRMMAAPLVAFTELTQKIPGVDGIPDVVNFPNHAGNLAFGASAALLAAGGWMAAESRHPQDKVISAESMGRFRRYGVPAVCAAAVLINSTIETKWGMRHLPLDELFDAPVADPLDTVYSTIGAGVAALAVWKKREPDFLAKPKPLSAWDRRLLRITDRLGVTS